VPRYRGAQVPSGKAEAEVPGTLRSAIPEGNGVRTVVEFVYEVEGAERPPCVAEVASLLVPAISSA
jgi:hypothetical protein